MVTGLVVNLNALIQISASMILQIFVSHQLQAKFQMVTAQAVKLLALTLASATTKAHLSASLLIWVTSLIWTGLFVKTHCVLM
jgi:putative methionine-R-sulfoxide reductase with GAF domain